MVKRKETNTHRFKGFNERIAAIKIDVTHKIQRSTETPEDEDTFFYEALAKWTELNCTLHFQNFASEVRQYVQSLAQLVHHKQEVTELLKTHLQIPESLALEPLLDLVVQLARDLQADFYPDFSSFFTIFVSLLNRHWQDTQVLECIFTTLSYLFKFLWRYMVKDIKVVFSLYTPLLVGEQRNYIQQFAAESFSFLMRKFKDSSKLFDILFCTLDSQPDLCQGLGFLCFEMIKGVKKQFHSMTDSVLPVLFSKTGVFQTKSIGAVHCLQWELVFQSLVHMLERVARYTVKEHCQVVEISLVQELEKLWSVWKDKRYSGDHEESLKGQIAYLLRLTNVWVSWKSGSLISDPVKIFNVVQTMLVSDFMSDLIAYPLLELASTLLQAPFSGLPRDHHQKQLTVKIFNTLENHEQLFTFCRHVLKWEYFQRDVMPFLLTSCQEELLKGSSKIQEVFLILTEVIVQSALVNKGGLHLGNSKGLLFFPKCGTKKGEKILRAFLDKVRIEDSTLLDKSSLSSIWSVLVCIPCISPLDVPQCCGQLLGFVQSFSEYLLSNKTVGNDAKCLSVLSQAIQSYILVAPNGEEIVQHLDFKFMLTLIR